MVAEKVHIDSIKITRKYDEFVYFYSCPRAKLSPGFLSLPPPPPSHFPPPPPPPPPPPVPGRKRLPISSKKLFLKIYFSPAQKREDFSLRKLLKIKLVSVLVTRFDKFHHLFSLDSFGCFIVP